MISILLVEDNKNLRILMADRLSMEGYTIFQAEHGAEALRIVENQKIDLLITDIMMPGMDGYQLVEQLRKTGCQVATIMVTAKETYEDKRKGFLLGIDDYMVKPIDINEMLLRVSALLRRAKLHTEHRIQIGAVILNYDTLTVDTGKEVIELPKKEFYLLYKLLSYPKKIFTRQQLLDDIWGFDAEVDERTVDSHIKKLRKKFGGIKEFQIVTIRGLGYKAEKNI